MKMIKKFTFAILLLGISLFGKLYAQATYYVATTGDDVSGTGTISSPWKTIQKAANTMVAGNVCVIRGGTYRETVTPVNSGSSSGPITFKAYDNETVIVSGADVINSSWTLHSGNIYKATVNWSTFTTLVNGTNNSVFVNDALMTQARWPNTGTDLLNPTLAIMDAGTTSTLIKDAAMQDIDWTGGMVWYISGVAWGSDACQITNYSSANKTVGFTKSIPWPTAEAAVGGEYFLVGKLGALDAPKEWFYDIPTQIFYLYTATGATPTNMIVEFKNRKLAFNLTNKSYINLENVAIKAASIDATNAQYCTIDKMKATYISDAMRGQTGIILGGSDNTIKNTEIAYSSGNGILVSGENHQIINNYIHDVDYNGTYDAAINFGAPLDATGKAFNGNKNIVISHNTASRAGRSILNTRLMEGCLVQYNDFSFAGLIAKDLGITYGARDDGANTEYRYNWFHDNLSTVHGYGFYLDNSCKNFISHHNAIWGVPSASIIVNHHSLYNLIYNNTGTATNFGLSSSWESGQTDDATGTRVVNNVFSKGISEDGIDDYFGSNTVNYANIVNFKTLPAGSPAIKAGAILKGITGLYAGSLPDRGAYPYGATEWAAGYNAINYPIVNTVRSNPMHRNLLGNASFERGSFESWTAIGSNVTIPFNDIGIQTGDGVGKPGRRSVFLGSGINGVKQVITGLQPNTTYQFTGYIKTQSGASGRLSVSDFGDSTVYSDIVVGNTNWVNKRVLFTTGATNTSATVILNKISSGGALVYGDDFGVGYRVQGKEGNLLANDFEDGLVPDWTKESGTWTVSNDGDKFKFTQNNAVGGVYSASAGLSTWANLTIETKVKFLNLGTGGSGVAQISFRYTNGNERYQISMGGNTISVVKNDNGVKTVLATKAYTITQGSEYIVKIQNEGNKILIYINGVLQFNVTDASILTGKVALGTYNSSASFDYVNVSTPSNNPPVVSDVSKSGLEDQTISFAIADFTNKFSDVDAPDSLSIIQIVNLPANGNLFLNGVALLAGTHVLKAEIPSLTFVPNTNWYGSTTFKWNGFDGKSYAVLPANVNITLSAVTNLVPQGMSSLKPSTGSLGGNTSSSDSTGIEISKLNVASSKLYPNPAKAKITLMYNSSKQERINFQLVDLNGKMLQLQNKLVNIGINQIEFNILDLSNGTYLIKWANNSEKFIKLN